MDNKKGLLLARYKSDYDSAVQEWLKVIELLPNYAKAYDAWKSKAQQTVDNAHMRYFIAHLHRLQDEEKDDAGTKRLDD